MNTWYDEENNILVEDMEGLLLIAETRQFGECENEILADYLMCEAFECRYDPPRARALHLAAMIISRARSR